MSNLKDLYISQSYFGIINLEDSTQNLASQSGDVELQDGSGDNIGLKINAQTQEFTVVNNFRVDGNADFNGNVDISGSYTHTGSLDVLGDITASGNITAHTASFDTINTRVLHVTEESASVIFSSGSNVLGDEITDTQVLSGSVFIPNVEYLAGNSVDTDTRINNLNASSASQQQSIDSINSYTQSSEERFTTIGQVTSSLNSFTSSQETINGFYNQHTSSLNSYTQSTDIRLDNIEAFTSSLVADFVTDVEYSASIAVVTGSLIEQIDTKLDTGSYLVDSASFDDRIDQLELDTGSQDQRLDSLEAFTSSADISLDNINLFTQSIQTEVDGLSAETSSYARLSGGNNFTGSQIISGGLEVEGTSTYTGSLAGNVVDLTVTSQTASMDLSAGNFFVLDIPGGSTTEIVTTNIRPGLTVTLQLNQPASVGTINFSTDNFRFPRLTPPVVTPQSGSSDVATFVSFDSTKLNGVLTNDLV